MATLQEMIGQRVKHRRMERHWLQKDFAAVVGWQPDYLSRFERGQWAQIDPAKLCALTDALEVDLNWLVRGAHE